MLSADRTKKTGRKKETTIYRSAVPPESAAAQRVIIFLTGKTASDIMWNYYNKNNEWLSFSSSLTVRHVAFEVTWWPAVEFVDILKNEGAKSSQTFILLPEIPGNFPCCMVFWFFRRYHNTTKLVFLMIMIQMLWCAAISRPLLANWWYTYDKECHQDLEWQLPAQLLRLQLYLAKLFLRLRYQNNHESTTLENVPPSPPHVLEVFPSKLLNHCTQYHFDCFSGSNVSLPVLFCCQATLRSYASGSDLVVPFSTFKG